MKEVFHLSRSLSIVILLFHFSVSSVAQSDPFSGFYINLNGDTVKGNFPKYRQWLNNPDKIAFNDEQTGKQIILTPMLCRQLQIDGYETYVAYHGYRMINPVEFQQTFLEDSSDRYETVTTFLREFAAAGQTRFYSFKDNSRFNLYYASNQEPVTELLHKRYMRGNHSMQSVIYKKQLLSLFPDRAKEINSLPYNEQSLASFLHGEKNAVSIIKQKQQASEGIYLSGGIAINSLKFNPDASLDFSKKHYGSHALPVFTIGYVLPFSRNFSRFVFLPQIKFTSIKSQSQVMDNDGSVLNSTTFKSSPLIALGFHVGYNVINQPGLQLSLAPGAGLTYLSNFEHVERSKFYASNSAAVVKEMDELKATVDLQATLIIRNRYVIWSAYYLPTPITIYLTTKDRFSSTQFGIGYKFR